MQCMNDDDDLSSKGPVQRDSTMTVVMLDVLCASEVITPVLDAIRSLSLTEDEADSSSLVLLQILQYSFIWVKTSTKC